MEKEALRKRCYERYHYLKSQNRCVDCTKQDAYTLSGRTHCAECAERRSAYKKAYREDPEKRERISKQVKQGMKRMHDKRIAEHRCTCCGRNLAFDDTHRACDMCRAKDRNWKRKVRAKWES